MSDPGKLLRLLLVEDSENDAMLLLRELRRGGYEPSCRRVDTPEAMQAALKEADERGEPWEVVISDYYMPRFRGPEALDLVRRLGYDTPFIVVSGKVGEDLAVEVMRAGAQDYITKENMARLNPAIERELREARVRRERRQTQKALDRSEERFRRLVEQAADAMFVHDLEGRFVDVNRRACESLGYTREELLALSVPDVEMNYRPGALEKLWREVSSGKQRTLDGVHRRKDGTTFPVEIRLGMFESEGTPLMLATARDVTDRNKAEEELRESEERFRATFEQAAVGILQVGLEGGWIRVNDRFCEITGYTREELQKISIFDLIAPEDLEADYDRGTRMLAGELRDYSEEKPIIGKGGRRIWINLTVSLVHDTSDEPRYFIAIVEDISQRRRAEDRLLLRDRAIAASSNGIVISDPNQPGDPIIYVNPAFERITGYTSGEVMGLNCRFLQGEDRDQPALEEVRAALREERDCTVVLRNYKKDGTLFWNELSVSPVRDEKGRLIHFIGVQNDISERVRAEEAVRESEKRFRALVQNASDAVIVLDSDGAIRYESPALERILGYRPEERIGKKVFDLIHPEDLPHVLRAFAEYMEDPGTRRVVEYRVRAKDGTWHCFEGVGSNLIEDPSVGGIVVNARDITDRKQAEREVRESEERYRSLFETMTQGVIYQDAAGRITSANPAAERILGLSLDQMQGVDPHNPPWRTIRENGLDLPVEEYPISVALDTGEEVENEVIGIFSPESDEYRWVNVTAVPQFRPGEDRPYQAYTIFEDITERKKAEDELQWSESSLAEAQRLAHLGNWYFDVAQDRAYWSDELYRIFGLAPQEFIPTYRTFLDYVHSEDRRTVRDAVRRAWTGMDRSNFEYRIVRPDGGVRFVNTWYECVWDVSGRPARLVGTIQDITGRKRVEETLRMSVTRFRTIIEQSPLSIQILSPDGRTLRVNRAWEDLWGATLEDLEDYNLLEDQQLVEKGVMPYIRRGFSGEPTEIPAVVYDPDESIPELSRHEEPRRWVQAFIYPVKDEAGNIREVTLIHEDVTERKKAEEELRKSEERFRATFEQAAVGVAHVDFDGAWLRVNDRLCAIVGYAREELLGGMTFQDITYPDDLRDDLDLFHSLIAGEISTYDKEKRYFHKDESVVWINLTVSTSIDREGIPEYCIAVIEDITDRKRAEVELERQAELINLSHDAIIVREIDGTIVSWNQGAEEVYGWSKEEALGSVIHELLRTQFPSSREDVNATLQLGGRWEGELRHTRRDGEVIEVESRQVVMEESETRTVLAINRDITERKRSEAELSRLATFPELNPTPIIEADATGDATYLNPAAEAWFPDLADHGGDHPLLADLKRVEDEIKHSGGRPLNREVRVGENFYLQTISRLPESGLLRIYVTDVTERHRAEDGLRFLAGASEVLSSSLDYHETLASVARLAVPGLADWCAIDVFERGSLNRLAVVHEDPEKLALARELQTRYPPDPESQYGVPQALREGRSVLIPEVSESLLKQAARDEEHLKILAGLGLKSYMAVPLIARGRTLGVITLALDESGHRYGDADLEFAEDLARRAAVAVDNARLYEDAQREISEREEAEAALRKSQERYRTFIAQSTEGIQRFELEVPISLDAPVEEQIDHFYRYGYLAECNDAMARMYGYAGAEELIGARAGDMLPRSVSENVTFLRAGISNGYRVVDAESQEFDRWDNRKYFLNNLTGIIEDGYVVRAWGTQRDVTEQRRAEEALRQSEELYRTVVEQAAENIFIVDVETKRILETNDAFRNSLGYEDEEIERMTLYDIVEADRESVDQNIQHILEKGQHPVGERQYRRRDGSKVDVEVSVSLVFMGGRQTMCVVAHDITERKRAEEALQEVREAERNRIARDLHDDILQNIVYALQETSILQAISEDGGAPELEEIADALRRSVEGLREAIFELRLEETIKQSFVVSLRSLIELNLRMSRKRYSLDLEVEGEFPEDIPHGVSREIMRILQEALNNARRHANPRHVWVRLGVEADELWVEVKDDGGGFDPETFVGGVGQHSMRQRAAKLGGRLRVESEPGSGTRMSFRVPYSRLIEE